MSKFITGKELEDAIYDIIWDAKQRLLIVSPFIKLDDYFKKLFSHHINDYNVKITIVFGKNEDDKGKSLRKEDFEFFKNFLNISIVYVPNLHAKYYANESQGVITSINLHDYSFKNNVEYGVYQEIQFLDILKKKTADDEAWDKSMDIANDNEVVFVKRPVFDKKMLSSIFGKTYVKSEVVYDNTEKFYSSVRSGKHNNIKKLSEFPEELILGSKSEIRPEREVVETNLNTKSNKIQFIDVKSNYLKSTKCGYCIRTGVEIRFNLEKPYSLDSYRDWNHDENYSENYCHFSGEKSYGKTSYSKPILKKYWQQAKEEFDLQNLICTPSTPQNSLPTNSHPKSKNLNHSLSRMLF